MTEANARQGRRNKSSGKRWQEDCAAWLRANGWPGAEYQIRNRSSDLTGTGDLAIECTLDGWDVIWQKLEVQAAGDARRRGLTDFCVWKKRNGIADPGKSGVLMHAELLFPLVQQLQELKALRLEVAKQFAQGFTAGVEYERLRQEEAG